MKLDENTLAQLNFIQSCIDSHLSTLRWSLFSVGAVFYTILKFKSFLLNSDKTCFLENFITLILLLLVPASILIWSLQWVDRYTSKLEQIMAGQRLLLAKSIMLDLLDRTKSWFLIAVFVATCAFFSYRF
jgi:hypothetical protein